MKDIEYRLGVNSLEKDYSIKSAALNDIVKAKIKTAPRLSFSMSILNCVLMGELY